MRVRGFDEERQQVESFEMVDFSELTWPMVVIYEKPGDFPNEFIGRIWDVAERKATPTNTFIARDNIEAVREDIAAAGFMVKFDRADGDDPVIRETWMR